MDGIGSDGIEKVHRKGVDIETAFTAGVRQASAIPPKPGDGSSGSGARSSTGTVPTPVSSMTGRIWNRAKAILRRPFVRLRRFFLAPLREELGQIRGEIEAIKRAGGRVAIPTSDGNVLVRTAVGYVLCSTADLGALTKLIETGELEPGTRLLIERLTGPNSVFVDAGANLGLYTIAAARAMQGDGRVHAFAVGDAPAALLRETARINGLTELVEVRRVGRSLDEDLRDTPVTLMLIDVEGTPTQALDGARSIIERNPEVAIIVELRPPQIAREGGSLADWFGQFQGLGLAFRVIDAESGRLWNRTIASLEGVESVRLLFARPAARAWLRAGPA